jgi:hypothetical protein
MKPDLPGLLCTQCGLCCDGSLLADVELRRGAETSRLEILGLEVDDDGDGHPLLPLPCAALEGRRCGIYAHRPRCCRMFECGLLQGVRQGRVQIEEAQRRVAETLTQIRRVEDLLGPPAHGEARLPLRERCAEALAGDGPSAPRPGAGLGAAMAAVERSIARWFLPREGTAE